MSWVQELLDLFGKFKFYEIVHEYEQALYFRKGIVIPRKIKRNKKELERIISDEREVIQEAGGYLAFVGPFKPELPQDYMKSKILRLPRHPKRGEKSKVLKPGLYYHVPFIDDIVKDFRQEKVLNLGNISIPTSEADSKVVTISCNLRYELQDLYKAYTAVHDYEASLKDHTLSILALYSRGKSYQEWKDPDEVAKLEEQVKEELRQVVTEKWGLKIHRVYVTDNATSTLQRTIYEGPALIAKN